MLFEVVLLLYTVFFLKIIPKVFDGIIYIFVHIEQI